MSKYITLVLTTLVMLAPFVAFADPPPWAPAWGYRAKHDHRHHHEHYRTYYDEAPEYYDRVDNAILSGTCNRDLVGGMIGGAAGGYLGSTIGKGDGNLAATAAGALIGFIIGQNVGRSMDQVDIRCTGYALEVAPDKQRVVWNNPETGNQYTVIPVRTFTSGDRYCREYTSRAIIGGRSEDVYGTACRNPDGSWQIVN